MQYITRPLQTWPRPLTAKRTRGDYSVAYDKCLSLLEDELHWLGVVGDVVIQIDLAEAEIRRDGLPYGNARPRTPRVAISFRSKKHGPLVYYCDAHHDWAENIRAIGLGLERLRLVERTGIVSRGEQYTGFKALPEGGAPNGQIPAMTVEEAARFVAISASELRFITDAVLRDQAGAVGAQAILQDAGVFKQLYKVAAMRLHPDRGGRPEDFVQLGAAAAVLEKFFGGT